MPGMGGRMSTVIKAKISRLLDRAEDPGETLDYSYQKQLESLQNVKKGIADVVTAKKRLAELPDVPAIAETLPGYEVVSWYGFFTTTGTPAPVIARLKHGHRN